MTVHTLSHLSLKRRHKSSVQQRPSFLPVSVCRWKLAKIQKTIFLLTYFHTFITRCFILLLASKSSIPISIIIISILRNTITATSAQHRQNNSSLCCIFFFFYSSVPNKSSLHSFAAPGKVPQAAILGVGGEKVVCRTERIIRSIFLQSQAAMTCKSLTWQAPSASQTRWPGCW